MPTTLVWQTSVAASALWGMVCLIRRQALVDPRIASALAEPATRLAQDLADDAISPDELWPHLLPLVAANVGPRHAAEVALTKSLGRDRAARHLPELVRSLREGEQALTALIPELAEDLQLRSEPWRQQWEARGPGLLHSLARLAEPELLPPTATVVLVQPALGGAGSPFASANLLLLEGVLTDVHAKLPEIVRLGWLVAQLNLDLGRYADLLPRPRLRRAAALAFVPLTLDAAEPTELARLDVDNLSLALAAWHLEQDAEANLAPLLDTWYGVYRDSRPTFAAGLKALDEMLGQ